MGQTTAYSGYGGKIKISSSVQLEVTEWNATMNKETTDVTRLESSGWTDRINTRKDFTGSFNANVLNGGSTFLINGTARDAVFYIGSSDAVTAAKPSIACRIIFSTDITVPAGQVTFSHSFESDGPATIGIT